MLGKGLHKHKEEGVSEALGFLLIFTMVIVGIGLVTLYGYPILLEKQVSADERIMEKNLIVLQNDIKSLAYKSVPYKETAMKVGGGSLSVYNTSYTPASATFDIYDANGVQYVTGFTTGDLRYESDASQTDISLQNGAVVMRKRAEPGSVMLAEPRWFYDDETNTVVINLIALNSTAALSRAGIGIVQMKMGETNYTYISPVNVRIYVKYTPDFGGQDYSVAWNNYFTGTVKMTDTGAAALPAREYLLPTDLGRPATLVIKKYDIVIQSL